MATISGLSGNEIYCLALKGYRPGEIVVGNSVRSLGIGGAISNFGGTLAGGELGDLTNLISEGRHAALARMEEEARKKGASGVSGVTAELRTLSGYTEFLAQGTAIHGDGKIPFFSTAASGIELYTHLDAGYQPMHFSQGNIAYALGIGRGILGSLRTLARGEVKDFSQMYNEIRHTALARLKHEAAQAGANAVVDIQVKILPAGAGCVEFLLLGTASRHPRISTGPVQPDDVATSELDGDELWNLAKIGFRPRQLVMATSIYSLGIASGIGALFRSMARGEIPELTQLIYEAREQCLDLVRREATELGAEQVIGNRLTILELSPGLIEVFAVGTAVVPAEGMKPESEVLIPQAIIVEPGNVEAPTNPLAGIPGAAGERRPAQAQNPLAMLFACGCGILMFLIPAIIAVISALSKH